MVRVAEYRSWMTFRWSVEGVKEESVAQRRDLLEAFGAEANINRERYSATALGELRPSWLIAEQSSSNGPVRNNQARRE